MASKYGKVAICISGLMRTGELAHVCFKNFFGYLDADVFYHTWDTPDVNLETINKLYNPVSFASSPPRSMDEIGHYGSMLYSIMMANELKKKHEIENNFRYDLVIKTRFDLVYEPGFEFPDMHLFPRTVYSPNGNNGFVYTDSEHHGINDVLFWGDSESMDIVTNTYMYYRHIAVPANQQLWDGIRFDPNDIYFSTGVMMVYRGVRRNIAFHRHTYPHLAAIPWREDVNDLDPIKDFEKIKERYQRL